ncbi:pitrilysin family protein [Micromonospora noduli]|uniref:Mitochondrial-processing peptidase subunit beta n=1 Tax=Micromonospora noduli TaxID=709876 RepID=A0A328N3J5_9ACTN|nr:pitrilysin family protein [Micromonospora noduli]KAB1922430.1 insulinase family protein [Micromonospora noduli]RAO01420.1 Mitochondrial-processing peptidase subunit beta [Micromonospora noduli]RAO09599.1 Mitochondrial-processing peptidase subunit beta [Micromonospora noduli]RAO19027.1 Mitochondrial-processing peptidase subunit beta [Micromonospora noduli]
MPDSGYPWPIQTSRLDNGLRVVVSEDRTAPAVAVNLWYDVGSRHEPAGQTGFAHLFEHLMFEGSVNVAKTEHMKLIQGSGGSLNATTNPDRTNYFETVPAEHLELALWLEADRMGGLVPALTQETLDNQRDVVKNERRQRYENVPYGDAWLRLLPLLYPPGHPYHHATIGSMADLNAADLATFQAFHQTYYAPNNAVLTVVGDATASDVFALADKYFGALPARDDIPPAPDGRSVPATGQTAVESVSADVPAPRVYIAHRSYPFGSPGYNVITVLATILGSGRGSRLYQRLADGERIAQPDLVGAYGVDLAHAPAPLIATATARPGVSAERLAEGLAEVVDELATVPVTAAELDRAKALLSTGWWRQLSTVDGRADLLGRYATQFGDPARIAEQLPALLAVTAEQIAEAAADVLATDRVTLTYLPEETS